MRHAGDHARPQADPTAAQPPRLVAERLGAVRPSPTMAVTQRAAELRAAGKDVIALAAGEPDFPTPAHVCEAAAAAIREGQTRYTAVDGTPALKAAVARHYEVTEGLTFEADEIIVSSGAKQCIFNALVAILDPLSEVLVPAPYWPSYPDMVTLAGGRPVILETTADARYRIDPAQLEAAIGPRTRLLILNAPGNPTGQVYPASALAELAAVLRRHPQLLVLSDDIYAPIYWGAEPLAGLLAVAPELRARTILVNGVSKAYAMTGWRIGWAAGPAPLVAAMRKVQSQTTSCASAVSQAAALAALDGPQDALARMIATYEARHRRLLAGLGQLRGVRCEPADGAFYAFLDVSATLAERPKLVDDVALATALLDEALVAGVPGSAFGAPGHLRLSFAASDASLAEALERMAGFFGRS